MKKNERYITGIWLVNDPFVKEILRPIQLNILVRKLCKGQTFDEIGKALRIPALNIEKAFKGIIKRLEAFYGERIKKHFEEVELLLATTQQKPAELPPNWPNICLN